MKTNLTFLFLISLFLNTSVAQVLFSEDFNSLVLDDGAAMVPAGWVSENRDGQEAYEFPGNFPFDQAQYATEAWAVTDFELGGEQVVISTALHGPVDNVTDRWLISPKVQGITAKSHLFWTGFTDNSDALDNCEVWVTTTIAGTSPTAMDFLASNDNKIMTFKMIPDEFNTYAARLADYEGQDIYFAIRNVSFIPARVILDDFVVKDAIDHDLGVKDLKLEPYWISGPTEVKVGLVSLSPEPITSVSLSYQVDGSGPVETETFAVALAEITDQQDITFNKWTNLAEGGHDIRVWVESVNGNTDTNTDNNMNEGFISVMNEPPFKRVLIQEYTGAWCGWCPEGAQFLKQLTEGDPTFVPVAVHSGDEMEHPASAELAGVAAAGYPSASFDFYRFEGQGDVGVGRLQWFDRALERIEAIVPVTVEVESHTYNRDTRELEVTVKTDFIGATKEELRLNVWIIEEAVTGPLDETGNNGWNNANYLDNDPTSPFFGLGPYLEPDEFKHDHVFNASLTGAWGDDSAFPTETTPGQSFSKTYTYTLPEATGAEQQWKAEDIHVVAFVSRHNLNSKKRSILNAAKGETFLTGIGEPVPNLASMTISPNPSKDLVNLQVNMTSSKDLTVRVFNQLGQEVMDAQKEHFPEGATTIALSLASLSNGIYFVSLYDGKGGIHTERVVVER